MPKKSRAPTSLEVHLLGPFRVLVDGEVLEERRWPRRKAKLLVKLLALQPHHRFHREQLMELLWPEQDPESSAKSIHWTIYLARQALEQGLRSDPNPHLILAHGGQIILQAPGGLHVDAEIFEHRAIEALKGEEPSAYEAALALYEGDLLVEDPYEDWIATHRERLRDLYRDLLATLARLYESRGNYQQSIERLKDLTAHSPADEEAHRRPMWLYARAGSRFQALRQYEKCRDALQRELDAAPDSATAELKNQILSGKVNGWPGGASARHDPASARSPGEGQKNGAPSHPAPPCSLAVVPFTCAGEDPELARLSDALLESIVNRLSRLPNIRVMARSTVLRYRGREVDPQEVGRELGVRAVLAGRTSETAGRQVVCTELIDTRDGALLWGEYFDRNLSGDAQGEEDLASSIARQVAERLREWPAGEG